MSCHQLLYTSRAAVEITDQILLDILLKADKNNSEKGISGLLLYSDNRFIQLIEANQLEPVETLFAKISRDERHTNVTTQLRQESKEFLISAWAMGFSMMADENTAIREHSFYIQMREVEDICASMPGAIGHHFRNFLQAR